MVYILYMRVNYELLQLKDKELKDSYSHKFCICLFSNVSWSVKLFVETVDTTN